MRANDTPLLSELLGLVRGDCTETAIEQYLARTDLVPAGGLIRRSTDKQRESLGDQRLAIARLCVDRGYALLRWYLDDAISGGSTDERVGLQGALADAESKRGQMRALLCLDIKRFSRADIYEAAYLLHRLRKAGVKVVCASGTGPGESDEEQLLTTFLQWLANREAKDYSQRTLTTMLKLAHEGAWMGGDPPYGYDIGYFGPSGELTSVLRFMKSGVRRHLRPDGTLIHAYAAGERFQKSRQDRSRLVLSIPDRVGTVRRIFEMNATGVGERQIAITLNREVIPSPSGGRWYPSGINAILTNEVYYGLGKWNERTFAKHFRARRPEGGAIDVPVPVPRPWEERESFDWNRESDWVIAKSPPPSIIGKELFEAASLRRSLNVRGHASGNPKTHSPYLLTRLLYCSCGSGFYGRMTKGGRLKKSVNRYYVCGAAQDTGTCSWYAVKAPLFELAVVNGIEERCCAIVEAADRGHLSNLVSAEFGGSPPSDEERRSHLDHQIQAIGRKISALVESFGEEEMPEVKRRITHLDTERKRLAEELGGLSRSDENTGNEEALLRDAVEVARKFKDLFAGGTWADRKALVRCFVHRITIDPRAEAGVIEWRRLPQGLNVVRPHHDAATVGKRIAGVGFEPTTSGL